MEIWKDIDDFPGYQVSDLGRVRTHNKVTFTERHGNRHWKDRILKNKVSRKDNCSRVNLWKNGKDYTVLVHRLEAVAFLGKPENDEMTVNHKDGNRQNNSIDNLEWLSREDNIRHGFETGLYHCMKPCSLVDERKNVFSFRSRSKAGIFLGRGDQYISARIGRGKHTANDTNGNKYLIVFED